MDAQKLTEERFKKPEDAIKKYGSDVLRVAILGKLDFRSSQVCNLKDDLIVPRVPPMPCTEVRFRLTMMRNDVEIWWQYFRDV